MKELLAEYRSVVEEFHPELAAAFCPGLSRDEIVEKLELTLHFPVSDDAIELYSWADGMDPGKCEPHVIPISFFMPLQSAIDLFEIQRGLAGNFPEKYEDSFQFLSDGSDGGYGFGSIDEPCNGRIIRFNIHDDRTVGYNSLGDLFETAIEAYKTGLLEDGEWCIEGFADLVEERFPDLTA